MGDDLSDVDRFLKESSKSYKGCSAKNSARRNSLMKKTLGLQVEHKLAAAELGREERQLRHSLTKMLVEKEKAAAVATQMRARSNSKSKPRTPPRTTDPDDDLEDHLPLDPYPITFAQSQPPRSRSNTLDQPLRPRADTLDSKGRQYAARSGRRQSKEFEDLHLNTATGSLAVPHRLLLRASGGSRAGTPSGSRVGTPHGSPGHLSPATPRRRLGSNCSASSVESLSGAGGQPWVGDPEAIGSVRRPRKSVGEQEKERLMRKEARLQSQILHGESHERAGH